MVRSLRTASRSLLCAGLLAAVGLGTAIARADVQTPPAEADVQTATGAQGDAALAPERTALPTSTPSRDATASRDQHVESAREVDTAPRDARDRVPSVARPLFTAREGDDPPRA
jgi:hypothetical protein